MKALKIGIVMEYDASKNLIINKDVMLTYSPYGNIIGISPFSQEIEDDLNIIVFPKTGNISNTMFGRTPVSDLDFKKFDGADLAISKLLKLYMTNREIVIIAEGVSFLMLMGLENCLLQPVDTEIQDYVKIISFAEQFKLPSKLKAKDIFKTELLEITALDTDSFITNCSTNPAMQNYECLAALETEHQILDNNDVKAYPAFVKHKHQPIYAGFCLPPIKDIIDDLLVSYK